MGARACKGRLAVVGGFWLDTRAPEEGFNITDKLVGFVIGRADADADKGQQSAAPDKRDDSPLCRTL